MNYPTIEDAIGKTPLVALQRLSAEDNRARGNVILGKLEGNNPAGSVKDRPAMSMIARAEEGRFDAAGRWLMERRWNGDQVDYGLNLPAEPVMLKVKMGRPAK